MRDSTKKKFGRKSRGRGYTVVELIMALSIFAIGGTGVLALQLVATGTNSHAKNLAVATQLARSWQEKLSMDALQWGTPVGKNAANFQLANTTWLQQAGIQDNTWHLPVNNAGLTFGPAANAMGGFVNFMGPAQNIVFCTHVRLTRILNTPNAQVLRSEVRVFWPKGEVSWNGGANYCASNSATVDAVGAATSNFNFVYQTSAIRQTPSF